MESKDLSTVTFQANLETIQEADFPDVPVNISVPFRCMLLLASREELLLFQLLNSYINPIISLLGFTANMFSLAILRRSGLWKPSNILLLGLVLADSCNQLLTMNFSQIVAQLGPNKRYPQLCGWQYGPPLNYFFLVMRNVFFFLGNVGQYVSATIPVLITLERLLAVFMPLTFNRFVTPEVAVVCVSFSFALWSPWIIFCLFYNDVYNVMISKDHYAMYFSISDRLRKIMDLFELLNYYVFDTMESWIPIAFVAFGCTLISIKVKVTISRRMKLTSGGSAIKKRQWSPRTTRTLVTTCFVFALTHVIYSVINYNVTAVSAAQYNILVEYMNLLYLLNSSSNFFVYIASNAKLKNIFMDIVHGRS